MRLLGADAPELLANIVRPVLPDGSRGEWEYLLAVGPSGLEDWQVVLGPGRDDVSRPAE